MKLATHCRRIGYVVAAGLVLAGIGYGAVQSGFAASATAPAATLHDRLSTFSGSDAALSSLVTRDLQQQAPKDSREVATYLKHNGFVDGGCPQSADRDCLSNILHYGATRTTLIRVVSVKAATPAQFAVMVKTQPTQ